MLHIAKHDSNTSPTVPHSVCCAGDPPMTEVTALKCVDMAMFQRQPHMDDICISTILNRESEPRDNDTFFKVKFSHSSSNFILWGQRSRWWLYSVHRKPITVIVHTWVSITSEMEQNLTTIGLQYILYRLLILRSLVKQERTIH